MNQFDVTFILLIRELIRVTFILEIFYFMYPEIVKLILDGERFDILILECFGDVG